MSRNIFYVYANYRKSGDKKDEIFYVGKGCNYRSSETSGRNIYWKNIVNKYGYYTEILYKNITEEMAFGLEISTIAAYGRRDLGLGPLANLTDGGEGVSGCNSKNEIAVTQYSIDGNKLQDFKSITEASINLKLNINRILSCCKGRGKTCGNYTFRYKYDTFEKFSVKYKTTGAPIIQYDLLGNKLNEFSSISLAENITGLTTVGAVCRGEKLTSGNFIFRFVGDKFDKFRLTSEKIKKIVQYDSLGNILNNWGSIKDASITLKIDQSDICNTCKGIRNSAGGFIFRYINDDFDKFKIKEIIPSSRKVKQFTIDGKFIKEWDKISDVSKILNIDPSSITKCCKGKYSTSGGFKFTYA